MQVSMQVSESGLVTFKRTLFDKKTLGPIHKEKLEPIQNSVTCQFCGKHFESKRAKQCLRDHIRKGWCEVVNENPDLLGNDRSLGTMLVTCEFCGQKLVSKFVRKRHYRKACKVLKENPEVLDNADVTANTNPSDDTSDRSRSQWEEKSSGSDLDEEDGRVPLNSSDTCARNNDSNHEETKQTAPESEESGDTLGFENGTLPQNVHPHWCSHCNKTFDRQSFELHVRALGRKEVCNKCGKEVAWAKYADSKSARAAWSKHKNNCKKDQPKTIKEFPCEKCGKSFKFFSRLREHRKRCLENKECHVCGKTFTTKFLLIRHQKSIVPCLPKSSLIIPDLYKVTSPDIKIEAEEMDYDEEALAIEMDDDEEALETDPLTF